MITTLDYIHRLVEASSNFTVELFQVRFISEEIRDKSTPDKEGMDWIHNQLDMDEYVSESL